MKTFNYNTINCTRLGEVTPNNLKEFADRMVNYFATATYNENGVNLAASVVTYDGYSFLAVTINGEHKRLAFGGQRVSEKMGRSIYNAINDVINDTLRVAENDAVKDIVMDEIDDYVETEDITITENGVETVVVVDVKTIETNRYARFFMNSKGVFYVRLDDKVMTKDLCDTMIALNDCAAEIFHIING